MRFYCTYFAQFVVVVLVMDACVIWWCWVVTGLTFQGNGSQSSLIKRTLGHAKLVSMLRKPFRRRSAPNSPIAPPRTKGRRDSSARSEGSDPVCRTWLPIEFEAFRLITAWSRLSFARETAIFFFCRILCGSCRIRSVFRYFFRAKGWGVLKFGRTSSVAILKKKMAS